MYGQQPKKEQKRTQCWFLSISNLHMKTNMNESEAEMKEQTFVSTIH
jgi:hypothetical protein